MIQPITGPDNDRDRDAPSGRSALPRPDIRCAHCGAWDVPVNQRHCRACGAPLRRRAKTQADDPAGLAERAWSQR